MRPIPRVLLVVAFLAVTVGTVEFLHPRGFFGLVDDVAGAAPPHVEAASVVEPMAGEAGPVAPAKVEIAKGDRAFDAGEFSYALTYYMVARAVAREPADQDRATRGARQSALAHALVEGAPREGPPPATAAEELERRITAAEARPTEDGWYELVLWAAGAGHRTRLPYLVQQALDAAQPGGVVERRLQAALAAGGPRAAVLREAMGARGLRTRMPGEGAPAAVAGARSDDDEPSGIGGRDSGASGIAGTSPRDAVPFGAFTAETRQKLRRAVDLQRRGAEEYRQTGPDSPNRKEHRRTAFAYLREARDIYQEAQEEDPKAWGLEERLRAVMEMIAGLNKDRTIDE